MFLIPGELIAILTFPGVVLHEFAHQVGCMLAKTKVEKVCYFRLKNPCGYVIHEQPIYISRSVIITLLPIVFGYGTTIILAICARGILWSTPFGYSPGLVFYFLIWLAFSAAMHALSSDEDIDSLWRMLAGHRQVVQVGGRFYEVSFSSPIVYRIVLFPLGGIIKLINALRPFWADAIVSFFIIAPIVGWI